MRTYPFARLGLLGLALASALTGCNTAPPRNGTTYDKIGAELKEATENRAVVTQRQDVLNSLLPPLAIDMPQAPAIEPSQRFDLSVVSAPAQQVLSAIVSGTRYSMVVHPDIKAVISLNLKQVTLLEVLNSVREIYGYDYKIDGTRIYVLPPSLQTRMFKIDYLTTTRRGSSAMRVSSNSIAQANSQSGGNTGGQIGNNPNQGGGQGQQGGNQQNYLDPSQSTQVGTSSSSDFWNELRETVAVLAGCRIGIRQQQAQPGAAQQQLQVQAQQQQQQRREEILCEGTRINHKVVISPQSGTVLVVAMPDDLKNVAEYLRVSQNAVERQVLIEAKIVELTLKDGYETGINWARFFTPQNSTLGLGQLNSGTQLGTTQTGAGLQSGFTSTGSTATTAPLGAGTATTALNALGGIGQILSTGAAGASLFGIAFQGANFAALLTFLESQGVVHTLSSPRIATMNNEKAVLKVGSDALFVTKITGGATATTAVGAAATVPTAPTFEFTSFFSGIALDMTPRINDDGSIILHVKPSISNVSQNLSTFNLGTLGTFTIPLVSNAISETDSVIRAQDGQIVAIGGLMRQAQSENRNQVPGLGNIPFAGAAFRNTQQASEKRELVILLKPTVVNSDANWAQDIRNARDRVQMLDRGFSWGGRSEVFGTQREERRP